MTNRTDYRQSHIDKGETYDQGLAASAWDSYMHRWEEHHLMRIVPGLFPRGIPRYLDFACGTGRMTAVIAPMAEVAVGVDVSGSMLDAARQKVPTAEFVQADLTSQPVQLGIFHLVTAFRFFGNAQPELRAQALKALTSLQPVGGYLIVNNHRNPNSLPNVLERLRGNSAETGITHRRFRKLLSESGYSIADIYPIGVWKYRGKLMAQKHIDGRAEERLERIFSRRAFVPLAPDTVIVARKVRECHE